MRKSLRPLAFIHVCIFSKSDNKDRKIRKILHRNYWLLLWKKVREEVKERVNTTNAAYLSMCMHV